MIKSIIGTYSKNTGFKFSGSIDKDFIIHSDQKFYYLNDSRNIVEKQYKYLLSTFVFFINNHVLKKTKLTNFEKGMIGKLPYLYKSFRKENALRFPIIFNNYFAECGCGRAFVARRYFPHMPIPAIIISKKNLPYTSIKNINQLMDLITQYKYWHNKNLSNINFGIAIDNNNIIQSMDYKNIDGADFKYEFVENAGTDNDQWQKILSIIDANSDVNIDNIEKILDTIVSDIKI